MFLNENKKFDHSKIHNKFHSFIIAKSKDLLVQTLIPVNLGQRENCFLKKKGERL